MEYPVYEFERKAKKSKRKRRIAVVKGSGMNSYVWWPATVDFSSRAKLDGGTVESILCVNLAILKLS